MPSPPIRFVSFDFWQTLFSETPAGLARTHGLRLSQVREALARAGHLYEAAAMQAADARAAERFEAIWQRHLSMSAVEQVCMFLSALDPALPAILPAEALAAVTVAYEGPALRIPPVLAPGAVEAIEILHGRGIALGVISNTGRTPGRVLRRLLERAAVLARFRVLTFSDEVGIRKPRAEIFADTLAAAGVPARAAVHLGDDPTADVAGARAAGMRAIHYVPDGRPPAEPADGVLQRFAELPALLARLA